MPEQDLPRATPGMLKLLRPDSTVDHADETCLPSGEPIWSVRIDGDSVARFAPDEDDFGEAEANAEHLVCELRDHVETIRRSAEMVDGLRAAADWIEAHPTLPLPNAWLSWYFWERRSAREGMRTVGEGMGAEGVESVKEGSGVFNVVIERVFGPVRATATAPIEAITGAAPPPMVPVYDPILSSADDLEAAA